jgi:hypothetical protein
MFAMNGSLTNSKDTAFRAVNECVRWKSSLSLANSHQILACLFFCYRLGISFHQQSTWSSCLDARPRTKSPGWLCNRVRISTSNGLLLVIISEYRSGGMYLSWTWERWLLIYHIDFWLSRGFRRCQRQRSDAWWQYCQCSISRFFRVRWNTVAGYKTNLCIDGYHNPR